MISFCPPVNRVPLDLTVSLVLRVLLYVSCSLTTFNLCESRKAEALTTTCLSLRVLLVLPVLPVSLVPVVLLELREPLVLLVPRATM